MFRTLHLILALTLTSSSLFAKPRKYDKETEINASTDSKFTISSGWSFDEETKKLTAPESDLTIYLIERKTEKDLDALALDVWKSVNPNFDLPVKQKYSPPPEDGWEQLRQVVYETPTKENRTVISLVKIYKEKAFVFLLDSSNSSLSKRGAQIQIVSETWVASEIKKEDLSKNKIKTFSTVEAKEMDKFILKSMKELSLPGAAIGIIQDGKLVYRKGFGVKSLGKNEKVTPETLFMIGSTTKPLTTLMLAKLVETGKLKWDSPIHDVLPTFQLEDKKITSQFQIKHTACACTGMPRRDMEFIFGSLSTSPEDVLQQLHSMKPTTGFGETFQYSNSLVAVGGFAGAQAYNMGSDLFTKYENVMNDLVFKPLDMKSTRVKATSQDNVANAHARNLQGKMTEIPSAFDDSVYAVAPAGSIWSNIDDMANYVMMELRNGKSADGKILYSEEQILKRRTSQVKLDQTTNYGLGLFLENNKGITIVGHAGNIFGFTHDLFFLPDHGVGMIIQTNAGGVNGFRSALKQKLLEILLAAKPQSEEMLQFSKSVYKQNSEKTRERISVKAKDNDWISKYVGTYSNKYLGEARIQKNGSKYKFITSRWTSDIATAKEKNGELLLALTTPPWSGGMQLRVSQDPRKLILDDEQVKYEYGIVEDKTK